MYTKVKLFNLALGALLLNKQIINVDTDSSVENRTLNLHWETALHSALQDMDLDATASEETLTLIEEDPNAHWAYAYRYPTNCAFLRRLQSGITKDVRSTQIPRVIRNHSGEKAIYTNEAEAIAEYISDDFPIDILSANAGLAIAYKLAILSAPLVTGKTAAKLREELNGKYAMAKAEAQEHDRLENNNLDADEIVSEFVEARIE